MKQTIPMPVLFLLLLLFWDETPAPPSKMSNNVIHNNTSLTTATIFHTNDHEIKNTISARKDQKLFRDLMHLWIR
ncbi:hypothetical protein IGI04_014340 [Brassica rapa subsp. trilocularis]|uniref:Uncharacterized protein n=1 Tax=Brassica rapa subsp. trilocularis TaxID=1813537 RepID=A0ABQ7MNH7_BRACM|nr:hypothetical protein IGI04_014340 [Brassica rapa subsp. trilocularis]